MKVSELIAWLSTQDQDAVVEVVRHTDGCGYYDQGGNAYLVEFDPVQHVERDDTRPWGGSRNTILLGVYKG